MDRIKNFENLKMGMFVHFGLYSIVGQGEWYKNDKKIDNAEYEKLMDQFDVKSDWAKNLVKVAKSFNAKYIVLTARHHDGFSLFDTKGLNAYDVMHTPTKRDLIAEFVDECNKENILPFFYMTMLDWHEENFTKNFNHYLDYLLKSVELLCTNYGKIGGFWFDGTWSNGNANWRLDELYAIIRKHQPDAIISNNGGLENKGQILNKEIDCLIFERGADDDVDTQKMMLGKHRAREVCDTLNDHWGYCAGDNHYKSIEYLMAKYKFCRLVNANFLLNVGPVADGSIQQKEQEILLQFGQSVKNNFSK